MPLQRCIEAHFWTLRACLHGDGGPQVGEITRLGGVTPIWEVTSYRCQVTSF